MLFLGAIVAISAFTVINGHALPPLPSDQQNFIVGGGPVRISEVPYQVALLLDLWNTGVFMFTCGGTIVRNDIVLTAARCTKNVQPSRFNVRAGSVEHANGGQVVNARTIVEHTAFADVALIFTRSPFSLGPNVAVVAMAAAGEGLAIGTEGTISGWGRRSESSNVHTLLHHAYVLVHDLRRCVEAYSNIGHVVDSGRSLCVHGSSEAEAGTCDGDEGGPLILPTGHQGGDVVVAGVASYSYGCARPGFPAVYTSVAATRRWIDEYIELYGRVL